MIYLDHNATTPPLPAVVEAVASCLRDDWANPSSTHRAGIAARRRIELARAQRGGQVALLALDWAKAFDSINVESLIDALRRFGLPATLLQILHNLLDARVFFVRDCGEQS